MATHEVNIHRFLAQGRTTSVSRQVCGGRRRSKAPVLELPKLPIYPSWVLQVARLTSTNSLCWWMSLAGTAWMRRSPLHQNLSF